MNKGKVLRHWLAFLLLGGPATVAGAQQQVPDLEFDARVPNPQLARERPRLLFDEAHFNVHRTDTTYRAFADLVRNDGARLMVNRERFRAESLAPYRLLVIAGALGAPLQDGDRAQAPAFTADEVAIVRQWVERGGGLLLLTDHEPVATATAALVEAFGVVPSRQVVVDSGHRFENFHPANVMAMPGNGLLRPHPASCGVERALVFGGQSLTFPDDAVLIGVGDSARTADSEARPAGNGQVGAFRFGRGRVVITGDMGMLSAQRVVDNGQSSPWGMNVPGIDNRRLVLNLVRWLAGHPTGCDAGERAATGEREASDVA
jgi:hypothetical protein